MFLNLISILQHFKFGKFLATTLLPVARWERGLQDPDDVQNWGLHPLLHGPGGP